MPMIRSAFALMTGFFIAAALVLPYVGGFALAYVLMLTGLTLTIAAAFPLRALRLEASEIVALLGVCLLMLPLVLTNDPVSLLNFAFLLTIVPISRWMRRYARPDNSMIVANLALAGSVLSGLTAFYQVRMLHIGRAAGVASDPIWSAQAGMLLGFLALTGLSTASAGRRLLLLLGPMIGVGVVLLSGSRGPILAVPVLFIILLVGPLRRQWRELLLLGLIGVVMGLLALQLFPGSVNRVIGSGGVVVSIAQSGATTDNSAGTRIAFWRASAEAFADAPLFGHGWSRRIETVYAHLPENGAALERADPQLVGNRHLHADILNIGVGNGLLGLVGYCLLLSFPLLSAWQSQRDAQWRARMTGAVVLTLTFSICGLTYIMIGYEFQNALFVAVAAIITGFCRDGQAPGTRGSA